MELDRIETNFRLSLVGQREMNTSLKEVGGSLEAMATSMASMASQMSRLAAKVNTVAETGEETAKRLEDSIQVMKSFAEGQAEIRTTLAECVRRLDALEGRKAS